MGNCLSVQGVEPLEYFIIKSGRAVVFSEDVLKAHMGVTAFHGLYMTVYEGQARVFYGKGDYILLFDTTDNIVTSYQYGKKRREIEITPAGTEILTEIGRDPWGWYKKIAESLDHAKA